MNILVLALDSMPVHNFHGQMAAGVKILLLLELIIVFLCIFITKKDILILVEVPTQGLDDTTITAEAKYPINFTRSRRRFVLSLHYNENNSFLFVNAVKMHKVKAKDLEIKPYSQCLGNSLKDFTIDNMKKTGLKGYDHAFSVDYNIVHTNDILDNHKYLIKIT